MTADAVKPKPNTLPRLLVGMMFHTSRRFSGPSSIAFSPGGSSLAFVSPKDGPAVVCEVQVSGGEVHTLFAIEGAAVHGISWARTGELYCTAHRDGSERWQVYAWRPGGKVEGLAVSDGDRVQHHMSRNAVSPDGKSVAIGTNARHADDVDLAIADVPAGWLADGRVLAITDHDNDFLHLEAIDIHSGEREVYDQSDWDVELASTSTDGRGVVWSVNEDGYSRLRWRFDSGQVHELETGGTVNNVVVSHDGARCAYTLLPVGRPVEIRVLELKTGEDRLLLQGEAQPHYPPRPESIRITGTEGDIPCYVFRPEGATGRTPALLVIHGGPEGQSRPQFMSALGGRLLEQGVAIVVPNIHGSTGYGKAWQARIHRDWGGIDLADLRSVAEWMREQRDFDPERMGVFGGSYGGFACLTCVTRLPEYWCCGVDMFGPSNLVTMLENDPPNWRRWNKLWIGDLETDREKLIKSSPISYVENVRCPMLVIQGDNDPRVPREESDQMVERLRALGRPVDYLTLEAEGHGFARRENQLLVHERIVEFLEGHLLGL